MTPDPFYSDASVTLYCGDAAEVLPHIEPCDLLVTDPPYGVDFQSNRRQQRLDKIAGDDGTYDVAPVGQCRTVAPELARLLSANKWRSLVPL